MTQLPISGSGRPGVPDVRLTANVSGAFAPLAAIGGAAAGLGETAARIGLAQRDINERSDVTEWRARLSEEVNRISEGTLQQAPRDAQAWANDGRERVGQMVAGIQNERVRTAVAEDWEMIQSSSFIKTGNASRRRIVAETQASGEAQIQAALEAIWRSSYSVDIQTQLTSLKTTTETIYPESSQQIERTAQAESDLLDLQVDRDMALMSELSAASANAWVNNARTADDRAAIDEGFSRSLEESFLDVKDKAAFRARYERMKTSVTTGVATEIREISTDARIGGNVILLDEQAARAESLPEGSQKRRTIAHVDSQVAQSQTDTTASSRIVNTFESTGKIIDSSRAAQNKAYNELRTAGRQNDELIRAYVASGVSYPSDLIASVQADVRSADSAGMNRVLNAMNAAEETRTGSSDGLFKTDSDRRIGDTLARSYDVLGRTPAARERVVNALSSPGAITAINVSEDSRPDTGLTDKVLAALDSEDISLGVQRDAIALYRLSHAEQQIAEGNQDASDKIATDVAQTMSNNHASVLVRERLFKNKRTAVRSGVFNVGTVASPDEQRLELLNDGLADGVEDNPSSSAQPQNHFQLDPLSRWVYIPIMNTNDAVAFVEWDKDNGESFPINRANTKFNELSEAFRTRFTHRQSMPDAGFLYDSNVYKSPYFFDASPQKALQLRDEVRAEWELVNGEMETTEDEVEVSEQTLNRMRQLGWSGWDKPDNGQ